MRSMIIITTVALMCACSMNETNIHAWRPASYNGFDIYSIGELQADREQIARLTNDAIGQLLSHFSVDRVTWLNCTELDIFVYESPNSDAGPGFATVRTTRSRGKVIAEFHVLAPSRHPISLGSNVGLPFDEAYFTKLVTHEVSTVVLELVATMDGAERSIYHAPSWFVQGYQEYLGLHLPGAKSSQILNAYYAHAKENPEHVQLSLSVDDDYIDGAFVVEFLHSQFGSNAIRRILVSEKQDFWAALQDETGLTAASLVRAYELWLENKDLSAPVTDVVQ